MRELVKIYVVPFLCNTVYKHMFNWINILSLAQLHVSLTTLYIKEINKKWENKLKNKIRKIHIEISIYYWSALMGTRYPLVDRMVHTLAN